LQTDLDLNLPYIPLFRAYGKFTLNNKLLALGICVPKTCPSAGRMSAASASRLRYYRQICSFPQQRIRWNALETGFHWESAFAWEVDRKRSILIVLRLLCLVLLRTLFVCEVRCSDADNTHTHTHTHTYRSSVGLECCWLRRSVAVSCSEL